MGENTMTICKLFSSIRIAIPSALALCVFVASVKGDDSDSPGFGGRVGTTSEVLRNLPSLEDLLSRALNNHPEIVAAGQAGPGRSRAAKQANRSVAANCFLAR